MVHPLEMALRYLFPARCPGCGRIMAASQSLCANCADKLEGNVPGELHLRYGNTPDTEGSQDPAERLICVAPFAYTGAVREMIHRFKFQNQPRLAEFFGQKMAETINARFSCRIDAITCVPMRKSSTRRYNPAELLARQVSRALHVPCLPLLLQKTRDNQVQHLLSAKERQTNVAGVYQVNRRQTGRVADKAMLLCDDIVTTGATLAECRQALLAAGAASVICSTAAATPVRND